MTVTDTSHDTFAPPTAVTVSRDPIARIVASSVLTGLVGALLLTLVVFVGATERVITGAALLAFATGWTMLAVLSIRMSSQPQGWAFVPAGAMGTVGTALLLFGPGDDALRALGWVWPAPVLALAVWIALASRRHLQSRARLGGPYAMTYAARYPDQVAGLVLLDATSPEAFTVLPSFSSTYSVMRRLLGVAPSLARLGLGQLVDATAGASLPAPANDQARAFATSPRNRRNQRDEHAQLPAALTQAKALTDLGGKPLAVVTAGEGLQAGWSAAQDRMAALSTNSVHRVAPADHVSLLTDKNASAYSVAAIADVVRSVRTRSPLPTS